MKEETARSILRLIAVATVLVGAILTTTTSVTLIAARSLFQGSGPGMQVQATGIMVGVGSYSMLATATIVAWGIALYSLSPRLARLVVE